MSLVVDALQPHILRGLLDVHGPVGNTIDDLLGKKSAFYPAFDGALTWTFDFRVSGPVQLFIAGDCTRFACAAFQTFAQVPRQLLEIDQLPWALIKAYYSAYYAAHALSRVLGSTCTYMEGPRVTTLRKVLSAYNLSANFSGGLYWTTISPQGSAIDFRCISTKSGGAHELFWHEFSRLIENLAKSVLAGAGSNHQAAWACLSALRSSLRGGAASNDNWLSSIRNDVQYKHGRGAWFHAPEISPDDQSIMRGIAEGWRRDPALLQLDDERCGELSVFIATCSFLVGLCRGVVASIEEQGKRGAKLSFASHGPMRFLKQRKL